MFVISCDSLTASRGRSWKVILKPSSLSKALKYGSSYRKNLLAQHERLQISNALERSGGDISVPMNEGTPPSAMAKLLALIIFVGLVAALYSRCASSICAALQALILRIQSMGNSGYLLYFSFYILLELCAVPAIPLALMSGVTFGVLTGTVITMIASTIAATLAFCIARYVARDKVLEWANSNSKFRAIDKALGQDGLRVVTLLRLSPILPSSAANYLYGLTSVSLKHYVAGTIVGFLPGTWGIVYTGTMTQSLGTGGFSLARMLPAVAGLGFAVVAIAYVTKVASKALAEIDEQPDTTATS
ncbi:hypothetical protein CYMTET_18003 [Cymbomonas tetramitiformis]|uniref:VTT domain-containing protein n=1 Tax=Cymbomonas tetramitiformis TaxID=36881 RepID=A0AAE0G8Y9_9CHLO|nr:hypothetical protein CYMTET_18003 [Cymbomonas tetramitiformis]